MDLERGSKCAPIHLYIQSYSFGPASACPMLEHDISDENADGKDALHDDYSARQGSEGFALASPLQYPIHTSAPQH